MNGTQIRAIAVVLGCSASLTAAEPCIPPCSPPYYQADEQAEEQNVFVAPQPQGEVAGESRSFGIRGLSIRIPESTISLPTIQFPGLIRYRRNAEMISDTMRMPVTNQADIQMQFAPTPDTAGPQSDEFSPSGCVTSIDQEERIEQLAQNMNQIQQMMQQMMLAQKTRNDEDARRNPNLNLSATPPERPLQYTSPSAVAPSPMQMVPVSYDQDAETEIAQLNQRIRELERLCQKMAEEQESRIYLERCERLKQQFEAPRNSPQLQQATEIRHVSHRDSQQPERTQTNTEQPNELESAPFATQLNW
ncbi:hypothetical protein GYB59_02840 [bacterium]|nr:hypothetical protein [bacterium]